MFDIRAAFTAASALPASQLWAWDARRAGGRLVCGAASAASASRSTHRQQPAANDGYAGIGGERRRVRQADPERLTRNFCAIPRNPSFICALFVLSVWLFVCLPAWREYAGGDSNADGRRDLDIDIDQVAVTRPHRKIRAAYYGLRHGSTIVDIDEDDGSTATATAATATSFVARGLPLKPRFLRLPTSGNSDARIRA